MNGAHLPFKAYGQPPPAYAFILPTQHADSALESVHSWTHFRSVLWLGHAEHPHRILVMLFQAYHSLSLSFPALACRHELSGTAW